MCPISDPALIITPQYKLHSYFMTCLLLQKMMATRYKEGQLTRRHYHTRQVAGPGLLAHPALASSIHPFLPRFHPCPWPLWAPGKSLKIVFLITEVTLLVGIKSSKRKGIQRSKAVSVLLHPSRGDATGPRHSWIPLSSCRWRHPRPWRGQAAPLLEEPDGAGVTITGLDTKGHGWPSESVCQVRLLVLWGPGGMSLTSCSDSRGVGGTQGGLQLGRGTKSQLRWMALPLRLGPGPLAAHKIQALVPSHRPLGNDHHTQEALDEGTSESTAPGRMGAGYPP